MSKAQQTLQKLLDIPPHAGLTECTTIIQGLQAAGVRITKQIAVLICESKYQYFANDYKGWLAWVNQSFDLQPRFANSCLNAGELLKAQAGKFPHLTEVGINELEAIHSIGNDRLIKNWLTDHDPREMSRAEIRDSVKQFRLADAAPGSAGALTGSAEPVAPAIEVPAIPGDDESATEFMTRIQRLSVFDPARLDPLKQFDYAMVYTVRFENALEVQAGQIPADLVPKLRANLASLITGLQAAQSYLTEG